MEGFLKVEYKPIFVSTAATPQEEAKAKIRAKAVEKIVIHCAATRDEELIRDRIRPDFSDSVPVSIEPSMLGMEYVQVHYSAGLLRPAHADVMVIN